ncbi:unnamed protein product [Sphagnum tenellum]
MQTTTAINALAAERIRNEEESTDERGSRRLVMTSHRAARVGVTRSEPQTENFEHRTCHQTSADRHFHTNRYSSLQQCPPLVIQF